LGEQSFFSLESSRPPKRGPFSTEGSLRLDILQKTVPGIQPCALWTHVQILVLPFFVLPIHAAIGSSVIFDQFLITNLKKN
jgi:hypothetical protein